MKETSKKLLLWLYPHNEENGQQQRRRVSYDQIKILLPDLTEQGRQSLIRYLEKKELLFTDRLTGDLHLTISSHGQSLLEAQFPVLKHKDDPWQGEWSLILFLQAPVQDKNFRYLRTFLLKHSCFAIDRGFYLHAGQPSEMIMDLLEKSYRGSVIIVQFDKLLFGDQLKVIGQTLQLQQLVDAYSEIGKDIKLLLNKNLKMNSLNHQQKQAIFTVFDQLFTNLEKDLGLLNHYFPQVDGGVKLLDDLKTILNNA